MQEALQWPGHEKWTAFGKCLKGDMRTVWDEVVSNDYPDQSDKTVENFKLAIPKLACKFLNHEKPRDVMLTWLMPNGGAKKDPLQRVETFALRWKTILRVIQQLPKGDIPFPTDKLQLVWFYHIFNKPHRRCYCASGRKWEDETFSSLVNYFVSQYNKDLDSGALAKVAFHQEDNRRRREKK